MNNFKHLYSRIGTSLKVIIKLSNGYRKGKKAL